MYFECTLVGGKFGTDKKIVIDLSLKDQLMGPFYILLKKDVFWFALYLVISLASFFILWPNVTKMYERGKVLSLLRQGYRPRSHRDKLLLQEAGFKLIDTPVKKYGKNMSERNS